LREHKYRFAQCVVFGIPVIALYFWGPKLGGSDSARWTGLLQSLLSGWIVYLGAVPLIAEGFLLIAHRQFKFELLVALGALLLYIIGVVGWAMTLRGRAAPFPSAFSCSVVILVLWSGVQWLRLRRAL
jgi:cation transport ATPase